MGTRLTTLNFNMFVKKKLTPKILLWKKKSNEKSEL